MANTNFGNEWDEFKTKDHICGTFSSYLRIVPSSRHAAEAAE